MEENLEFLPVDRESPWLDELVRLYDLSFPDYERKPFEMILKGVEQGSMEAFALVENGHPAGLAFVILGKDAVVLDYLAVSPEKQNRRYGSFILELVKNRYPKPVIVEIESTRGQADEQKQRRKAFYLRNGLFDCHSLISLFGVEMELLSTLRPVSYAEYEEIMHEYFHERLHQYVYALKPGDIQTLPQEEL